MRIPVMNVVVLRRAGWYGKFMPVELLCNGKCIASLRENEEVLVTLGVTDIPATLEIRMFNARSPSFIVDRLTGGLHLECGPNLWPLFDFLDLAIVSPLKNRVFYLQRTRLS
jgi:hypothetical protein